MALIAFDVYRTASGAPGPSYRQQRADYNISVDLNDDNQQIIGSETIAYHNHSPDVLRYLWVQLDADLSSRQSDSWSAAEAPAMSGLSCQALRGVLYREGLDSGLTITKVATADGANLPHTIVKTMMRVDLPKPLGPGEINESFH